MNIRLYSPHDYDALMDIFDSNCPFYLAKEEKELFHSWLNNLQGNYYVVELEGAVVGCGGVAYVKNEAHFCWGLIHNDYHGKGYGKALSMYRLEEIRKQPNVTLVKLETSQHTYRFFEKLGFRTDVIVPDGFGPGLDNYKMILNIPTSS